MNPLRSEAAVLQELVGKFENLDNVVMDECTVSDVKEEKKLVPAFKSRYEFQVWINIFDEIKLFWLGGSTGPHWGYARKRR